MPGIEPVSSKREGQLLKGLLHRGGRGLWLAEHTPAEVAEKPLQLGASIVGKKAGLGAVAVRAGETQRHVQKVARGVERNTLSAATFSSPAHNEQVNQRNCSAGVGPLRRRGWCEMRRRGIRQFATVAVKPLHASVGTYRRQRSGSQAVAVGTRGLDFSHLSSLLDVLALDKVRMILGREASSVGFDATRSGNFSSQELEGKGHMRKSK